MGWLEGKAGSGEAEHVTGLALTVDAGNTAR